MNYELFVYQGAIGGALLYNLTASSPFMAIAVGQQIAIPNGAPLTVTAVLHEFGQAPGPIIVHQVLIGT